MARELTCKYCEQSFIQHAGGTARFACYKPECEKAHAKYMLDVKNKAIERWRERQVGKAIVVSKRKCSICGRPLPRGRYFYHAGCLADMERQGRLPRFDHDFAWA